MLGHKVFKLMAPSRCGRCGKDVYASEAEACHVCFSDLCCACWDEHGECDHGGEEEAPEEEAPWPACTLCGSTDTEKIDVGREGRHLCAGCGRTFWSR